MHFLFKILLPVAFLAGKPVVLLDVLLEFSGCTANLEASQLLFLQRLSLQCATSNRPLGSKRRRNSSLLMLISTLVDWLVVSRTRRIPLSSLHFSPMSRVTAPQARQIVFKAQRRHRALDNFVLFFNNAIPLDSDGALVGFIESLIVVQQIEEVASCPVEEEQPFSSYNTRTTST